MGKMKECDNCHLYDPAQDDSCPHCRKTAPVVPDTSSGSFTFGNGDTRPAIESRNFDGKVTQPGIWDDSENGAERPDAKAGEFSVILDGAPLGIESLARFSDTDEGIAFTVLLDISKTMAKKQRGIEPFAMSVAAVEQLLDATRAQDRFALLSFGTTVETVLDFTGDKALFKEKLKIKQPLPDFLSDISPEPAGKEPFKQNGKTIKDTVLEKDIPGKKIMARLIKVSGPADLDDCLLSHETLIGRNKENNICLMDNKISGSHCRICREGGFFTLEDLKSRNGTTINGAPVSTTTRLRDNDMIQIGEYLFKFRAEQQDKP